MGKWCIRAALATAWLTASAAAYAQTPPAPALPPAPPQAGFLPPPQGVCPPHAQLFSTPNAVSPAPPAVQGAAPDATPAVEPGPSAFSGEPDCCPPNAFTECTGCADLPCCYLGVDYLGWWTKRQDFPALVTSGSTADPVPAALGQPNTTVLFGPADETITWRSGVRLNFAIGSDCDTGCQVDGSAFVLFQRANSYNFAGNGSAGSAVLARPFFNVAAGAQDAAPFAVPGVESGALQITTPSILYGADLNASYHYWAGDNNCVTLLAGFRFLSLDEALNIQETSQNLPTLGVLGGTSVSEDFVTHNNFYGGQVGAGYEFRCGPLSAALVGKVAAGPMVETIHNSASTSVTDATGAVTTTANTGLYVSPGNAGVFSKTHFAVAPEGDVKLGFIITPAFRLSVGYSFLYVSSVARPGDQINVNVLPAGTAVAAPTPQSTTFWAQGINAGVEFGF